MKNKQSFLINICNYFIVKHHNRLRYYGKIENKIAKSNNMESEDSYKNMLQTDTLPFEANPEIQSFLEKKIIQNTHINFVQKNSFVDIFTSFFNLWHFELKMGVVGLAFAFFISIGNNNESLTGSTLDSLGNKAFLCDTFPVHSSCLADSTIP